MALSEGKRDAMAIELNSLLAPLEKVIMFGGCTAQVDRLGATVTRQATAFVTNQRFGVLSKKIGGRDLVEIPLSLISSVEFERNITAAQINVVGAGVKLRLERMQVNGAREFIKVVREQVAKAKAHVDVRPPTSAPSVSMAVQISELADLHAQGVLTPEEFATAKSKLING